MPDASAYRSFGALPPAVLGNVVVARLLRAWISRTGPILTTIATTEIYENTFFNGRTLRPWAFDGGRFVALEHRRRFVAAYIADRDGFDPSRTDYYAFIEDSKARGFTPPYEGCAAWAYADANGLCRRYMRMVDIVLTNLSEYQNVTAQRYLRYVQDILPELAALERDHPVKIFNFAENRELVRKESRRYAEESGDSMMAGPVAGHHVPSAVLVKGKCILWNGSHRLAIFKALEDAGYPTDRFPVAIFSVKNTCPSAEEPNP